MHNRIPVVELCGKMCSLAASHNKVQREIYKMKRTTLISASLLLAFAGCTCGQGWRPNFLTRWNNRFQGVSNVGEPCDAGCHGAAVAPIANSGCTTCGSAGNVNYGGYEHVGDSYEVPMGIQYGTSTATQYQPSGYAVAQPQVSRMEPIAAKRAN